ncbi:unnamed protein product, partial [Brassica oleracea]
MQHGKRKSLWPEPRTGYSLRCFPSTLNGFDLTTIQNL